MGGPPDAAESDDRRLIVGKVTAPWGVKGWVKLLSHTDPADNLLDYADVELGREGRWRSACLSEGHRQGKGLVGRFEGVTDRDGAEDLRGLDIAVRRSQLPPVEQGEYYWADLVGLRVENTDGVDFGTVERMLATGANDVLIVRGDRERLIPFVRPDVVVAVDVDAGLIRVDWDADF